MSGRVSGDGGTAKRRYTDDVPDDVRVRLRELCLRLPDGVSGGPPARFIHMVVTARLTELRVSRTAQPAPVARVLH